MMADWERAAIADAEYVEAVQVAESMGVDMHDRAGHQAVSAELVRLTLGGKPQRVELQMNARGAIARSYRRALLRGLFLLRGGPRRTGGLVR